MPTSDELMESMSNLLGKQAELAEINEEERSKVLMVKQKYNERRMALYHRRNEIIGFIPGFWEEAFLNHPKVADWVNEEDKKIFKYMISLEVKDFIDENSGYSITFNFSPNPFFEGTKLTKIYSMLEDGRINVTTSTIKWKDGKNIPGGFAQENKGAKRPASEDRSFFYWFREEQKIIPVGIIDMVARTIREELWTDPVKYFNNEVYDDNVNGGGSDNDNNDHDDKENDDEDFNGRASNDVDNDDDDEEDDDEAFNESANNDDRSVNDYEVDDNDEAFNEDDDEAFNVDDDSANDDDGDNDDETKAQDESTEEQNVEPDDDVEEASQDEDAEDEDDD